MNSTVKKPRYRLNFKASGYSAPNAENPTGIRIQASGYIIVDGVRPKSGFNVPFAEIERCKKVFMEQTGCARFAGDCKDHTSYPTIWLGKQL